MQLNRTPEELVRLILAEHLEVDVGTIRVDDNLAVDLGLTPLAVVLVVLDLEDLESLFLPFEHLDAVKTVADLAGFLARARAEALHEQVARPNYAA